MDSRIVLRLQPVSPFTSRLSRSYSGSAAALNEEATKAVFSSPPHNPPFRLWLMGGTYRTFGRRRASPVTSQNHFLQATARITRVVHVRLSTPPAPWDERFGFSPALRRGAVSGAPSGRNAISRSHLAWPLRHTTFSGPPSGDALAAYLRRSWRSASKVFCTGVVPHR